MEYRQRVTRFDVAALQALHEELLPVQYPQQWYHDLIGKETHFSVMALVPRHKDAASPGSAGRLSPIADPALDTAQRLVGFATGRWSHDEEEGSYLRCNRRTIKCAYIMTIGVKKDMRHQGIGSRLLQHLIRQLLKFGCQRIDLHCTTDNDHAVGMYQVRADAGGGGRRRTRRRKMKKKKLGGVAREEGGGSACYGEEAVG